LLLLLLLVIEGAAAGGGDIDLHVGSLHGVMASLPSLRAGRLLPVLLGLLVMLISCALGIPDGPTMLLLLVLLLLLLLEMWGTLLGTALSLPLPLLLRLLLIAW
jgi:hypothetical protein